MTAKTRGLVEIARGEFKEAEGARKRPDAIEYLSVHCDISPPILGSPSEAQKVPVRGILHTANGPSGRQNEHRATERTTAPTEPSERSKTNGLERLAWPS